jgi:hypothetical protein
MIESCTYPRVTAHVAGSAVQKLSKGGHGMRFDEAGVARLRVGKTSGRLMQQRKPDGVVGVLLAREQRGRANKAAGWAKQWSVWK